MPAMLFNSLVFVAFFAVVYPVYRALPHGPQNRWLLAASLFFYGWWDWRFLGLLLLTSTFDWFCARRVEDDRERARMWTTFSVVSNLTVLGVFKYLGFFTRELDAALVALGVDGALPVIEVVLPVGLSFYTFQAIGYTVDVYRGHTRACRGLADFLLFISFFPHLVAGPIQRTHTLIPQLLSPRSPTVTQLAEGAWLILWGYVKKVVVADNLSRVVARGFDADGALGGGVVLASYAFTWQIYCDFSGYSDIARGLAKWLGVELIVNFDLPFFASSPRDIWRRWHISLSQWLRDYLYIPLGGNQRRAGFNLVATMVLGGLWHGANWTFLAWGAWHGVALAIQRRVTLKVPKVLAIVLTFHFLMLGFVLFRARSLSQVGELIQAVLAGGWEAQDLQWLRLIVLLCMPIFLVELAMYRWQDHLVMARLPRPIQAVVIMILVASIVVLGANYGNQFIYFQF